jgi:cytochrome c oxidase subunit 4
MSEFATHEAQEESESHASLYLRVWVVLLILTVVEYFYAKVFADAFMGLVVGLMVVASIKAALVGQYFMHVKWEGKWIYGVMVPAAILACVLIGGLMPDIANSPTKEPIIEDEQSAVHAPISPSRASVPAREVTALS